MQLDLFGAENLERTPDPREREAVLNTALTISGTDVIDDRKATGKPGAPRVTAPGPGYGIAARGVGDARLGTADHPLLILKPVVDQALVEAARGLEQLSAASQIPLRYCKAAVKAHLLAHLHDLPISEALDGRIASDGIFRWFLDGETGVTASMVEVCATHFSSTVDKPFFDPVLRFACARELQWLPCFRYSHWLLMRCLRLPLG